MSLNQFANVLVAKAGHVATHGIGVSSHYSVAQ